MLFFKKETYDKQSIEAGIAEYRKKYLHSFD